MDEIKTGAEIITGAEPEKGTEPEKRKRGRPPKPKPDPSTIVKRPRGRPPKPKPEWELPKRPRGRPRKTETGTGDNFNSGTGTDLILGTGGKTKKGTGSRYAPSSIKRLEEKKRAVRQMCARNEEEKAYNTALINHIMRIQEIAMHTDKKDIVSLRAAFFAYVKLCQEDGFRVGNMGAASAMGIWHDTLLDWKRGQREEYRELANLVLSTCSLARETVISDSKINPVTGIFWQRNFDGLRNDTEQINPVQAHDEEQDSASEYMKRYGHLLPE